MAEGKKGGRKTIVRHYTSEEGAKGIKKDGVIKPSTDTVRDAALGPGVYFNKMDPDKHSKSAIAKNNYDDGTRRWESHRDKGRVDYVVEMKLDADKIKQMEGKRDVGVHKDPIHLKDVEHRIRKVPDNKK